MRLNLSPILFSALAAAEVVKLDFSVNRGDSYSNANKEKRRQFVKREDTLEVALANEQIFYAVDIQIGEEQQNVSVLIDTGSSDLWVMGTTNPYCSPASGGSRAELEGPKMRIGNRQILQEELEAQFTPNKKEYSGFWEFWSTFAQQPTTASDAYNQEISQLQQFLSTAVKITDTATWHYDPATWSYEDSYPTPTVIIEPTMDCGLYGTFDDLGSSSFQSNDTVFSIQYADYTYAYGEFGVDDVTIGGIQVSNLSFAVASEANSSMGVLGIGLNTTESTSGNYLFGSGDGLYENLPAKMVSQGLIAKNAYSLYLDSVNASSGTVLFGGVDHAKYTGTLQTVKVINQYSGFGVVSPLQLDVTLSGVTFNSSRDSTSVLEDAYPALLDSGTTSIFAPVDFVDSLAAVFSTSNFSSDLGVYLLDCSDYSDEDYFTFDFTGAKIKVPASEFVIEVPTDLAPEGTCALGVFDGGDAFVLGDSFLRSAYVVYDLESLEISLAQANTGTDGSDIEAISSSVPSATPAAYYSSTWTTSDFFGTGTESSTRRSGGTTRGGRRSSSVGSSSGEGSSTRGDSGSASHFSVGGGMNQLSYLVLPLLAASIVLCL